MSLFDTVPWLIFVAPFLGLLCSALVKRREPRIVGEKIYRHDGSARISHWTHGIGTLFLLISGIYLGNRIFSALVSGGAETTLWFNVHFVAAWFFLFGTFFYLGNAIVSRKRFKEHLPSKDAISRSIQHYGSKLGIKKFTYPVEGKYFQSENMAYIMALVVCFLLVLTGIVKTLAHIILTIPEGLLNAMTWIHDIAAVLMLVFFVAHIIMGSLVPWAWKTFPSIITGWMPREEAEHEHQGWYAEIVEKERAEEAKKKAETEAKVNDKVNADVS